MRLTDKVYTYFDNDMQTHFDEILSNEIECWQSIYNMFCNAIINKDFTDFKQLLNCINNDNFAKKLKKAVCYKMEV